MSFGSTFTVCAAGIAMWAAMASDSRFADFDPTHLNQTRQCITEQFKRSGFNVSSSSVIPYRGYVDGAQPIGPAISVAFNEGGATALFVKESSFLIPRGQNDDELGTIHRLSQMIARHCARSP